MLSAPLLGLFFLILSIISVRSSPAVEAFAQQLHRQVKAVGALSSSERERLCRSFVYFFFWLRDITTNRMQTQKQIEREVDNVDCQWGEILFREIGFLSLHDVRDMVNNTIRFFKYLNGIRTPSSSSYCPPCYLGHSTPREDGKFEDMNESMKLGQWILRIADEFKEIPPDQLDEVILNYMPLDLAILKIRQLRVRENDHHLSANDFLVRCAKNMISSAFDGLRRRNRATVQLMLEAWVKFVEVWSELTGSDTPKWTALGFLQDTGWPTSCFPTRHRVARSVV